MLIAIGLSAHASQHVSHDPAGDRAAKVAVPGDGGTKTRQDPEDEGAAVDETHQQRDQKRDDPMFQEPGKDQERGQARDQPAGPT